MKRLLFFSVILSVLSISAFAESLKGIKGLGGYKDYPSYRGKFAYERIERVEPALTEEQNARIEALMEYVQENPDILKEMITNMSGIGYGVSYFRCNYDDGVVYRTYSRMSKVTFPILDKRCELISRTDYVIEYLEKKKAEE